MKSSYKNNKFEISAPTWYDGSDELPDGSYSVSDIQYYFEYIIKKHETLANNPATKKYINKLENRITFTIKTGYYLELVTVKKMELLGNKWNRITLFRDYRSNTNTL